MTEILGHLLGQKGNWIYKGVFAIVYKGNSFSDSCLLSPTPSSFLKGVYTKREELAPLEVYSKKKEFAPLGANSFLLEQRAIAFVTPVCCPSHQVLPKGKSLLPWRSTLLFYKGRICSQILSL